MEREDFDFLHGAMSFDDIWDEISCAQRVLAVAINDTLGERLHEGCSEAYILKFDKNTTIYNLHHVDESLEEKSAGEQCAVESKDSNV